MQEAHLHFCPGRPQLELCIFHRSKGKEGGKGRDEINLPSSTFLKFSSVKEENKLSIFPSEHTFLVEGRLSEVEMRSSERKQNKKPEIFQTLGNQNDF